MRLDEISKAEFVDGLKDPAMAELKKMNRTLKRKLNLDGIAYSVKAYEHPDLPKRRKVEVTWDLRYIDNQDLLNSARIDTMIGAHYQHELDSWALKGWQTANDIIEFELVEA